jgi:hypothetical protein
MSIKSLYTQLLIVQEFGKLSRSLRPKTTKTPLLSDQTEQELTLSSRDADRNRLQGATQSSRRSGSGVQGATQPSRRRGSSIFLSGIYETIDPALLDDSMPPHPGERGDPEGQEEVTQPRCSPHVRNTVNWEEPLNVAPEDAVGDMDRRNWDVFRKYTYESSLYACEGLFRVATKVLKVVFVMVSFALILTSLVTSKLAVLFAASNLNPDVGFRKNMSCPDEDDCATLGVPVSYEFPGCKSRDVIRWLWCMLLCMCIPYLLTFLRSMWAICFTKKRKPTWSALLFVSKLEKNS